jgi:predicted Holliday junction resolvase-like endonuclease
MIKFFRQIRYQLMSEHKIGKYLKYAIGEIVLVIIGILIAVSINDWNTDRKLRIEEQAMLKDLRKEVEGNIQLLDEVNEQHERSFKAAEEIEAMYKNRENFDAMTDSSFFALI